MPFPYTFPVVFSGTATPYPTVKTVVNRAALELGLNQSSDPVASSDANMLQLIALLGSLGEELWRARVWTSLTKEYVFTTQANVFTYPFPADFGQLINQTAWDRTNQIPAAGPLTPQEWQMLKARQVNLAFVISIRQLDDALQLFPNTAGADRVIAYEYLSRNWVASPAAQGAGTGPDQDAIKTSNDVVWFPPLLMVKGLRLAFRDAKGFDTTSDQRKYDEVLALCMGDDAAAPALNLAGAAFGDPLLTIRNFPDTGFGGG